MRDVPRLIGVVGGEERVPHRALAKVVQRAVREGDQLLKGLLALGHVPHDVRIGTQEHVVASDLQPHEIAVLAYQPRERCVQTVLVREVREVADHRVRARAGGDAHGRCRCRCRRHGIGLDAEARARGQGVGQRDNVSVRISQHELRFRRHAEGGADRLLQLGARGAFVEGYVRGALTVFDRQAFLLANHFRLPPCFPTGRRRPAVTVTGARDGKRDDSAPRRDRRAHPSRR